MENPRDRLARALEGLSQTQATSTAGGGTSRSNGPRYGYIRSTDTWGVNSIPFLAMQQAGLMPMFASNDPNLAAAMSAAQKAGIKAGIWLPEGQFADDPIKYAQQLRALYDKYGTTIHPNIEAVGKGVKGSKGWDWNDKMMGELSRLGVPPELAVAVMGEADFNYGAYTSRGTRILAETFGPNKQQEAAGNDPNDDPDVVRANLKSYGIPDNLADLLVGPRYAKRGDSVYTIDDLKPDELLALATGSSQSSTASTPETQSPTASTPAGSATPPPARRPDAQNPQSVSYSKLRLAQLARLGYTPSMFGLSGDPTALWRGMSAIMGATQAVKAGQGENYTIPANTDPAVAAMIERILGRVGNPKVGPQ